MKFYYALDGKPVGPVTLEALAALRSHGLVDDATLIVGEGESQWVTYGKQFPAAETNKPLPPPVPTTSVPAPPVPPKPAAAHEQVVPLSTSSQIERISAAAYAWAMAATNHKDEFHPEDQWEFPVVRHEFKNGDSRTTPQLCLENYALVHHASGWACKLNVAIFNRPGQGSVQYNTAKVSGGESLEVTHLDSNVIASTSQSRETLAIGWIPLRLLMQSLHHPLRLQISRPNTSHSFIIEVPVDLTIAVVYRSAPDLYEVDPAIMRAHEKKQAAARAEPFARKLLGIVFVVTWVGLMVFTSMSFVGSLAAGGATGLVAGRAYFMAKTRFKTKASPRPAIGQPAA